MYAEYRYRFKEIFLPHVFTARCGATHLKLKFPSFVQQAPPQSLLRKLYINALPMLTNSPQGCNPLWLAVTMRVPEYAEFACRCRPQQYWSIFIEKLTATKLI